MKRLKTWHHVWQADTYSFASFLSSFHPTIGISIMLNTWIYCCRYWSTHSLLQHIITYKTLALICTLLNPNIYCKNSIVDFSVLKKHAARSIWNICSHLALACYKFQSSWLQKRQKKFTAKVNVHESLIVDFVNQDGDFVTACHSS